MRWRAVLLVGIAATACADGPDEVEQFCATYDPTAPAAWDELEELADEVRLAVVLDCGES